MKKLFVLFLTSTLFLLLYTYAFADSSKAISLDLYKNNSFEKNGRQYRRGAFEHHEGESYLMLSGDVSELEHQSDIHQGTPVIISFDKEDYTLFVDHVHVDDDGEILICIKTQEVEKTEIKEHFDLELKFYSDDLSIALYSAKINDIPAKDDPMIPQTGDGAIVFILAAVISLSLMAFLLAPKKIRSL